MKKDIYQVFDNMTENFDEITVEENVEVDKQRVKEGIFSRLGMKNTKKRFGKKLAFTLIAATLAIGIISTSVIAAVGTLKPAFGEIFSGDLNASHLYSGGNVSIHSYDDNLSVELLGVSGDDTTAYASIQLTKKDGTSFLQSDKSILSVPCVTRFGETEGEYPYVDYHNYHNFEKDKLTVTTEKSLWQTFNKPRTYGKVSVSVNGWKFLTDEDASYGEDKAVKIMTADEGKTLKIYVKIINDTTSPKGRNVTVSCKEISEYVPVKLLKTFDKIDDESDRYIQLHYGKNKIDGMFVYDGDDTKYDYWEIANNKISLPFDISFKMNYKSDIKTVELDEQTGKSLAITHNNDNAIVTLSSFGMNIRSMQVQNEDYPLFDSKSIKIAMKDGTVYRVLKTVQSHVNDNDIIVMEYRKDDGTVDFDNMDHILYSDTNWQFINADMDILDIDSIDTLQINDSVINVNS